LINVVAAPALVSSTQKVSVGAAKSGTAKRWHFLNKSITKMIQLNLEISNPWSNYFKSGPCWSGKLSKHKFWELQAMRTSDIVCVRFEATARKDHAGLSLELGLLSFNIAFMIYDSRHWDHIGEQWTFDQ
jgi:hypothetical protein